MSKTKRSVLFFVFYSFVIFQFQFSRAAPNTFINKYEKSVAYRQTHTRTYSQTQTLLTVFTRKACCCLSFVLNIRMFMVLDYIISIRSFIEFVLFSGNRSNTCVKKRTQNRKPYKNRDEKKSQNKNSKLRRLRSFVEKEFRRFFLFFLFLTQHSLTHTYTQVECGKQSVTTSRSLRRFFWPATLEAHFNRR